jgi:hypothetical protein
VSGALAWSPLLLAGQLTWTRSRLLVEVTPPRNTVGGGKLASMALMYCGECQLQHSRSRSPAR